jgi:hypothetical protein
MTLVKALAMVPPLKMVASVELLQATNAAVTARMPSESDNTLSFFIILRVYLAAKLQIN